MKHMFRDCAVYLLILIPTVGAAEEISVTGTAEVQVIPDRAVVRVTLRVQSDSRAEVVRMLAAQRDTFMAALESVGVNRAMIDDVELRTYESSAREDKRSKWATQPRIYGAIQFYRIHLDDFTLIAPIGYAALRSGAEGDFVRIEYVASDYEAERTRAFEAASKRASEAAKTAAAAVGKKLGSLIEIDTMSYFDYASLRWDSWQRRNQAGPPPGDPHAMTFHVRFVSRWNVE